MDPPFIYPWITSIQIMGRHSCGGTLINPTTVITAAHCVKPLMTSAANVEMEAGKQLQTNQMYKPFGVGMMMPKNILRKRQILSNSGVFVPPGNGRPRFNYKTPGAGKMFSASEGVSIDAQILANTFNVTNSEYSGLKFNVTNFIMHPDYAEIPNFAYDVAILKVKLISGNLWGLPQVLLDDGTMTTPGTVLTAAGWGMRIPRGKINTDFISQIQVPVVESNRCEGVYAVINKDPVRDYNGKIAIQPPPGFDRESSLCAGDYLGRGICQGDSGGPLFGFRGNNPVLVGISSHANGFECARKGVPDVYAMVSSPGVSSFLRKYI